MKNFYLTGLIALMAALNSYAQVSFGIVEPPSIAGGYNFSNNGDVAGYGLPDLLNPLDAVMDTVIVAEDGTPGTNAQGIPFSNEACGALINNVAGKIVMVYRYDGVSSNVCWTSTKMLNAQNAGAVGVIVVNNVDQVQNNYGSTPDGASVTIPYAFIGKADGALIRARLDAGDDVIAFIGNKQGLFADDIGIMNNAVLRPAKSSTASLTSQTQSEYGFAVGATIYNRGTNLQSNVSITATVNGPAGQWTETAGPFSIPAGDSIDVLTGGTNNIPGYSQTSYPTGRYTLDYSVSLGGTDEATFDDQLSYSFLVSDSIISYAGIDTSTNLPYPTGHWRPSTGSLWESCIAYSDPNASRLAVEGMYFTASAGQNDLSGEEIGLTLYEWNDVFTDLNDPNLDFANLNMVGYSYYYYPSNLSGELVYNPLEFPVQLIDNQRYLACISNANSSVWLGFNDKTDYTGNINYELQPVGPVNDGSTFYALGFGSEMTPLVSLKVFDSALLSTEMIEQEKGFVYPNPSTHNLNVRLNNSSNGIFRITDVSGRIVHESIYSDFNTSIEIEELKPGKYTLQFIDEDGTSGTFPFIKN